MMNSNTNSLVYFEKQGNDLMCGLHCVNALLQGPVFNEVSMAQIAQQLDVQERELLGGQLASGGNMGGGVGADGVSSHNVANSGNYSLQVLEMSLHNRGEYQCVPIVTIKNKDLAETCHAFLCHKGDHWIAIRKVHNVWYNLNSTNIVPPGPQYISHFQLDAFLASIKNSGFHIYSVEQGDQALPMPDPNQYPQSQLRKDSQFYMKAADIYAHWQQNKTRALNFQGADEMELEAALKASMAEWEKEEGNGEKPVGQAFNKKEEEKPVEKFIGSGKALGGVVNAPPQAKVSDEEMALMMEYENDPELLAAILQSMQEVKMQAIVVSAEPASDADPATVSTVQFKGPSGQKFVRKFLKSNTINDLINFYKHESKETAEIGLLIAFPKKDLSDGTRNLEDLKFAKTETVMVKYL